MKTESNQAPVLKLSDLEKCKPDFVLSVTTIFAKRKLLRDLTFRLRMEKIVLGRNAQSITGAKDNNSMPNSLNKPSDAAHNLKGIPQLVISLSTNDKKPTPNFSLAWDEIIPTKPPTKDGWFIWIDNATSRGWLYLSRPPRVILKPHRVPYWLN